MTLTPRGLVVFMAKKIPQDVAFRLAQKAKEAEKKAKEAETVSYTHLTLPTSDLV